MIFYSVAKKKKKEIAKFPERWMELEKIMLNDDTQTQKDTCFYSWFLARDS